MTLLDGIVYVFIQILCDIWLSESENVTWFNGSTNTPWLKQRYMMAYGKSDSLIYLLGGTNDNGSIVNTAYTFNPNTYEFNELSDVISPKPFRIDTPDLTTQLLNNIIILSPTVKGDPPPVNGHNTGLIFNIITNTYDNDTFSLLPYYIEDYECVVSNNIDMIYVMGGGEDEITNELNGYNFTSNKWIRHLSSMNIYRSDFGCEYVSNKESDIIYVFGGSFNQNYHYTNTIEKYIVSENKWILLNTTILSYNNDQKQADFETVLFQDSILLIGGGSEGYAVNVVQYFDLITEKIDPTKTTFLNQVAVGLSCINWKNAKIFVFCGNNWEYGMYI